MLLLLVAVIYSFAFPRPIHAQLMSDRHWVVFRQSHGLGSDDVFSILVQDNAIWFGTANGISRYDGRWQTFAVTQSGDAANGEPENLGRITAMASTEDGATIWAAGSNGILSRYEDGTWAVIQRLGTSVNALEYVNGELWLATDRGVLVQRGTTVEAVAKLGTETAHALAAQDGFVWVATDLGLWRVAPDTDSVTFVEVRDENGAPIQGPFLEVTVVPPDQLWLGTLDKVVVFSPGAARGQSFPPFSTNAGNPQISSIVHSPGRAVWAGSESGGAVEYGLSTDGITGARNLGSSAGSGLSTNSVRDVAIDANGSVWFATAVGVFRYQPWAWNVVDERYDFLPVHDLLVGSNGDLWIATGGEGVQRHLQNASQPAGYLPDESGLPGETVYDLAQSPSGQLWAATNQGAAYFEQDQWRRDKALLSLSGTAVRSIAADDRGAWLGTSTGLARYNFGEDTLQWEALTKDNGINAVEYDSIERLWVAGGDASLWLRTADGKWRDMAAIQRDIPFSAPVTAFTHLSEPPGTVLAAFRGYGVYRSDGLTWQALESGRRTTGDRIFCLMADPSDGSIWIGSETGLARIDSTGRTTYDTEDGIQTGSVRAIAVDREGSYWFGGERGLAYYEPETSMPWVRLDQMSGAKLEQDGSSWQAYAEQPLTFQFSFGDLQTNQDKIAVFVRSVENGQPEAWVQASDGEYQLTLAQPGHYTFEFKARDQAFNYSPVTAVDVTAIPVPAMISVPLLGEVEVRIFQLLVLFGSLAIFGFGYVSFEIVQHRRRIVAAVERGYNPYISGEPVRRVDMFFGRHDLLRRIVSTLHNNSIMIHGERRIGKTTLLYQLANALQEVEDEEFWFVSVYIDLEGTTEEEFFHLLMDEIAQTVRELPELAPEQIEILNGLLNLHLAENQYTDREFNRDLRQIIHILEEYGAVQHRGCQVRLILLMDEMDTLSRFNHLIQQQLRRIFMRDFAATLGAVVAGIEISKEWERVESPWFNLFNEIAMAPFSTDEAIQLLTEPVRGYYMFEPDALDFIVEHSDGRPYRLQQYALEAVNQMLHHKRRVITLADVLVAHELIQLSGQQPKGSWGEDAARGELGVPQTPAPAT
ncbi:MAG: hypothetical protein KDD77_06330 [Caldilineaceae bacterium]|nr:hypothetical protein [Caldilineaceae bacterium]